MGINVDIDVGIDTPCDTEMDTEMDKDMDTDIPMDMATTWKYLKEIVLISGYRTDPIFSGVRSSDIGIDLCRYHV